MSQDRETNLALFIDFDNVALGARDARQRFEIKLMLQRLLEKGKVIVKKAYADWHYYKEYMSPLHEAAIELIEIPMPRISGKNSADIRLVVDAMDLCYNKDHIDTFVIVSGDSDFSPLVSKLRENNKRVIGIGMKNSSSKLLIGNCDEFIFYDDLYRQTQTRQVAPVANVPADKRELFDFLVETVQSLLLESRGVLYSSLIKDTMTRKQPAFSERAHGFSTFGDLLDEARHLGLLVVERDAAAGGTWVVQGLGTGNVVDAVKTPEKVAVEGKVVEKAGTGRSSRRRRRSGRGGGEKAGTEAPAGAASGKTGTDQPAAKDGANVGSASTQTEAAAAGHGNAEMGNEKVAGGRSSSTGEAAAGKTTKKSRSRRSSGGRSAGASDRDNVRKDGAELPVGKPTGKPADKPTGKPADKPADKAAAKPADKPADARKASASKAPTKKTTTKKAPAKKTTTKKTVAKKAPAKKTATKKTAAKKTTAKKAAAKKTTPAKSSE